MKLSAASRLFQLLMGLGIAYAGLVLLGFLENPFLVRLSGHIPDLELDDPMPVMSALTAESVPWESSGLEGHPALVFYFGTEVPQDFFDMAVELTIKFEDLRVVGITPRPEVVLNDLGPPPFPLLGDRHGDLSEKLGLNGPSALFLFDRSGKVRFGKGGLLGREDLRQLIEFTVTGDVDYRPFSPDTEFRGDLGPLKVRNLESELETQLGEAKPSTLVFLSSAAKTCYFVPLLNHLRREYEDLASLTILVGHRYPQADSVLANELRVHQFPGTALRALEAISPLESTYFPLSLNAYQVLILRVGSEGRVLSINTVGDPLSWLSLPR